MAALPACSAGWFSVASFQPSYRSISPPLGQSAPRVQLGAGVRSRVQRRGTRGAAAAYKAGQEPQVFLGRWEKRATIRPCLYSALDSILKLGRPGLPDPGRTVLWSTPR